MNRRSRAGRVTLAAVGLAVAAAAACGPSSEAPPFDGGDEGADRRSVLSRLDELPPWLRRLMEPWTGDLDGMAERRVVRIVTAHNPMLYSLDGPEQRGIVYESAALFEKFLNQRLGRKRLRVAVVIVPVHRNEIIPALVEGRGDIAVANLTITPERLEHVDFSEPVLRNVSEIVVTGPSAPELKRLADLSGKDLYLRPSSSYWASVERLNRSFERQGLPPVKLTPVASYLEDHDLIDMVHAGLVGMTVVDDHKARFWAQVFDEVTLRDDLVLREGGEIAWAMRKDSPKLRAAVNAFVRTHRKGTLIGNLLYKRYLEDTSWLDNAFDADARRRFHETAGLFREYGERYGFDWLLLAAQGYQESKLDQDRRSRRGAVGIMQVLPSTAHEVGVERIDRVEGNIRAGVKYLRLIADRYFADPDLDPTQRHLFALAAYNAGPTRVRRLRAEAARHGLDPDVWFDNVEVLVARKVGVEPVRYVSNIVKYWAAYKLLTTAEPQG